MVTWNPDTVKADESAAKRPAAGLTRQLDDGLWVLDTMHQDEPGVVASYLLSGDDGLALVDVGPAKTLEYLLTGIRATGHRPEDIRHIVLTHIHLDHAGATGDLVRLVPAATVYVHPLGAPHLIDPTKLLASARRIYGDEMDTLWGGFEAVPAGRIVELADDETIAVGGRQLTALHTPGHAVHHIAYHDPARNVLFAGDVAGVRLAGLNFVRPPTPPPDLSLEDWSASLSRLRELGLREVYLPHFGVVRDADAHLDALEKRLYEWGERVLMALRGGQDVDTLAETLAAEWEPELKAALEPADVKTAARQMRRYELATNYRMTVLGYERYYRRRHPEWLA